MARRRWGVGDWGTTEECRNPALEYGVPRFPSGRIIVQVHTRQPPAGKLGVHKFIPPTSGSTHAGAIPH